MNLAEVKRKLEALDPQQGLRWVSDTFDSDAKFSSSFGLEDQVITHFIGSDKLSIEVFTLDTGRLFQETYDAIALTTARYSLPIRTYYPDTKQVEDLVSRKGPNSFYDSVDNRKECCHIRKGSSTSARTEWCHGMDNRHSCRPIRQPAVDGNGQLGSDSSVD